MHPGDDDLPLEPVQERTGPAADRFNPPPFPSPPEAAEERRYTLAGLLLLVTAASVLLAGLQVLEVRLFALLLGLVWLGSRVLLELMRIDLALLWLAWWMLGLLYLVAIVAAIL